MTRSGQKEPLLVFRGKRDRACRSPNPNPQSLTAPIPDSPTLS